MRIKDKVEDIDYEETKDFFKKRAEKFNMDNPYSVTMYQDNNAGLVRERNEKEIKKLLPMLNLSKKSRVLDVACGIGRWADAMPDWVESYCGIDFSGELIEIARERNKRKNFSFYEGSVTDIEDVLKKYECGKYSIILMVGILMYLNDKDLLKALKAIERVSEEHAVVCVREPIGIDHRLTLKDFYSDELKDNYNAIYRTGVELKSILEASFGEKGFLLDRDGFLFDEDALNNRKETAQYYYIFVR